jgi:hypothetical protein
MLAELHARWEREDDIARNMTKVCTIITTSDVVSNASTPPTLIGVEKIPTPCAKLPKTMETFLIKVLKFFGEWETIVLLLLILMILIDGCNMSEVILFLQKLARSPNASSMNAAFTKHITNALMQIREDKMK